MTHPRADLHRGAQRIAVLFPGAFGDFLCFLPTLCAMHARHAGPLLLIAQPHLLELVRLPGLQTASIGGREIADLFAVGAPVASETRSLLRRCARTDSWTGFGNPTFATRLAQATGGSVHMHPFRGMRPGEHAVDYYARCAGVAPSSSANHALAFDAGWAASFLNDHRLAGRPLLVVHAGSGSPKKNWQGFDACVRLWRAHHKDAVVQLSGPAEGNERSAVEADAVARDLSLPQVAALLRTATLYVGNDSGISHLAGIVGTAGVVLFGASDPAVWAPRSPALHVLHAPASCRDCSADSFCIHRLAVETVVRALDALRAT